MKIIRTDATYRVYNGNTTEMLDKLPAKYYRIGFDQMSGWYLEEAIPLEVSETIYGEGPKKINKIIRKFQKADRNLGVLLSGYKGIGKSMFARQLCIEGHKLDYPVLVIDQCFNNLSSFLSEITQPVIVLFDEFDKMYGGIETDDEDDESAETGAQNGLLSLFDGVANTRMLIIVTCNSINRISDLLINRPGRFHYHIRFGYPDAKDIERYLCDNLVSATPDKINAVLNYAHRANLTYDCLRAIVDELNDGGSFEEAIEDLNIGYDDTQFYCGIVFEDGAVCECEYAYELNFDQKSTYGTIVDYEGEIIL